MSRAECDGHEYQAGKKQLVLPRQYIVGNFTMMGSHKSGRYTMAPIKFESVRALTGSEVERVNKGGFFVGTILKGSVQIGYHFQLPGYEDTTMEAIMPHTGLGCVDVAQEVGIKEYYVRFALDEIDDEFNTITDTTVMDGTSEASPTIPLETPAFNPVSAG